jgi:hypothetical protein
MAKGNGVENLLIWWPGKTKPDSTQPISTEIRRKNAQDNTPLPTHLFENIVFKKGLLVHCILVDPRINQMLEVCKRISASKETSMITFESRPVNRIRYPLISVDSMAVLAPVSTRYSTCFLKTAGYIDIMLRSSGLEWISVARIKVGERTAMKIDANIARFEGVSQEMGAHQARPLYI